MSDDPAEFDQPLRPARPMSDADWTALIAVNRKFYPTPDNEPSTPT